jgi:predicted MFS family arabinose efflux permease
VLQLLRRNRDFRTLFIAQLISFGGDWFATVAILGLVRDRTDSDLLVPLVFVSQALPAFFLSPFAGPVADRFDRRFVMIVVSTAQILAALIFLGALEGPVFLVFVAQASISVFGAFFGPASQAALPNLVDAEDLPVATALIGATWGAMVAVGAGLGGLFTSAFGRTASFIADAVSFAIAALLISSIRRPMRAAGTQSERRTRPFADTAEGLRYARQNKVVSALLMSKAGFGLSSGLVALLAVLADGRFGAREKGIGFLLAARGAGIVLGPFIARHVAQMDISRVLTVCGLSALLNGAMYFVVPLAPALWLVGVFVFAAHLGGGTQWTLSSYGLQVSTPDELRGRIFATDLALVTLTMTISFIVGGVASNQFGPRPVMLVLAVVNLIWGISYLWFTRRLRHTGPVLGETEPHGHSPSPAQVLRRP